MTQEEKAEADRKRVCDRCGKGYPLGKDLRAVNLRVCWGVHATAARNDGYSERVEVFCEACRDALRRQWRFAKLEG